MIRIRYKKTMMTEMNKFGKDEKWIIKKRGSVVWKEEMRVEK